MIFAISTLTLLLLPNLMPMVQGMTINGGATRSGRTVVEPQLIRVDPDPQYNWATKLNLANASDYDLTDYNLTWKPFFQNNSDLQGIVVHNIFAPTLWNLTTTGNQSVSIGSFFRLTPDMIMDGASEVWFRLPFTDIPTDAIITVKVARVMDPTTFNMSFTGFQVPTFAKENNLEMVYFMGLDPFASNHSMDLSSLPRSWINYTRWQNISIPNATNYHYNFTYVKACFGLFPNEWYFLETDILINHHKTIPIKLALSSGDFGSDSRNNTWIWANGTSIYLPMDADTPFVMTYGVSNGITGIAARTPANYQLPYGTKMHINASVPIGQVVNAQTGLWFNMVVPFFLNRSMVSSMQINLLITFYSGQTDAFPIWTTILFYPAWNASYNMMVSSVNLTTINGHFIDHLRWDATIGTGYAYEKPQAVRFWGTQLAKNWTHQVGFTDIYSRSYWLNGSIWQSNFTMYEEQWFVPFGYFGLNNWRWNQTNASIIVIPELTPNSESGILEMLQKFKAYITPRDRTNVIDMTVDTLGMLWDMIVHWAVKMAIWEFFFIYNILNKTGILGFLEGAFQFFLGIGNWLWDMINLFFDAMEWFAYWMVRVVYSLTLAIVYIVNVFGVISINSALFAVTKTGHGKEFVRAFQSGWKFVLTIITLMISLGILAVSIVGAVVPF